MAAKLLFLLAAASPWYDQKLEGWYYFEEEKEVQLSAGAKELLEEEKQTLQDRLALAVLDPTIEHVEEYMREQKRWTDQSALFSEKWGQLLSEKSEPTQFLLFCFRSDDPISRPAAEAARLFGEENHWILKSLSLDGGTLDLLPDSEIDRGLAEKLNVVDAPAFFVVDPVEMKIRPVGTGPISVSDLERNIGSSYE